MPSDDGSAAGRSTLVRSEITLVFRRRRNIAMLLVLICAPILIGIAIRTSAPSHQDTGGPAFIGQIAGNGLFLGFTALVVTLAVLHPARRVRRLRGRGRR